MPMVNDFVSDLDEWNDGGGAFFGSNVGLGH